MSRHSIEEQTLALAGVFQAADLVKQYAYHGTGNLPAAEASLASLLKLDAPTVHDIYGSSAGVMDGLKILRMQLAGRADHRDMEVTRYVLALLHLSKKLSQQPQLMQRIGATIEVINGQLDMFPLMHENTQAKLAELYKNTVSTLQPRIMVNGEHMHLNNERNAQRIRALLLAGIRSAILWNQIGGSRLRLLFTRKKYLNAADGLIRQSMRVVD